MEVELFAGDCERVCVEVGEVCGRLQLDLPVVRFLHVVYTVAGVLASTSILFIILFNILSVYSVLRCLSVIRLSFCYLIKGPVLMSRLGLAFHM